MTAPNLWIQPTAPAGTQVGFGLSDDSSMTRSGGTGAGGWQLIDRPRNAATTEWVDWGPFQLTISLIIDGYGNGIGAPTSIEGPIALVESWETPVASSSPPLPPILAVSGPVPHNELQWVLQNLNWKEAIRDPVTGVRYQQNLDVVLWQYLPPSITVQNSTPAKAAQAAASTTTGAPQRTYTVKAGDTLMTIAASLYGTWQYWTLLANANSIRDPNTILVGQTLQVPPKTTNPPALAP